MSRARELARLANANAISVDTSNNVGLGTTSSIQYKLDVVGDANFTGVITATAIHNADGVVGGAATDNINSNNIKVSGITTLGTTSTIVGSAVTFDASGGTVVGVLTATSFEGDGSSLTGVAATDYIVSNSLKVLGISTFSGEVTAAGGVDVTGGVKSAGIVTFTNTTASTSSATGALVVSGGVGIAGSLHVGENVSVGGTLTYEDVTNIDVIGIITARAGVLVNGGRGIDIAGGGLEVAGITTLGTNVKIGSAVTFNNNSGINVTGIVTATGLDAGISVWILGADGTSHYTFSGPGLTGAENDPTLYLQRGQKYVFQNRSGGHPFRIQSTVNGSSGTAYSDGVTNNDAANGTDLVWNVQQDAPSILYYQCTSHGNMGGVIYIGSSSGDDVKVGVGATIHASSGNAVFAGIVTATTLKYGTTSVETAIATKASTGKAIAMAMVFG